MYRSERSYPTDALVGYTGFVGTNLARSHKFTRMYNSKSIEEAFGTHPGLLVYSGVPSAMFLANDNPEADLSIMRDARENIRRIGPERVVLISSIAVYADSRGKDEDSEMNADGLPAYGRNRLLLEEWVREDHPNATIVRLPALYGEGLKKNFIYDLINITPALLKPEKYEELSVREPLVGASYADAGNGFMKLKSDADLEALRSWFADQDFNAMSFTDSRSRFQFYDLGNLWDDISSALDHDIKLLNLATPPVTASEVYQHVNGKEWVNELAAVPFDYDMRTKHADAYGGADGYLCTRDDELAQLKAYIEEKR